MRAWLAARPLLTYGALAFGFSWGLGIPAMLESNWLPENFRRVFDYSAKFGPSLAGVLVIWLVGGRDALRRLFGQLTRWRVGTGWWLVAAPFVLWSLAAVAYHVIASVPLEVAPAAMAGIGPLLLRHTFLGGGLGEEIGWRGFLLPKLAERMTALRASLVIGLVWGLWHAPVFFVAGQRGGGAFTLILFTVYTTVLAVLFTWAFVRSRGSLLLIVVVHGAINAAENVTEGVFPAVADADAPTYLFAILLLVLAIAAGWSLHGRSLDHGPA